MGVQSLQAPSMKVRLLVCLSLVLVVSLGWGEALTEKHEEGGVKTEEVKDQTKDIPSIRNVREAKKEDGRKNGEKGKGKKKRKQGKVKKNKKKAKKNRKVNKNKRKAKKNRKVNKNKRKS